MTPDVYVRTGDAGIFEKDGQLRIIDRAKDVSKLRTGALFAPKIHREQAEKSSPISARPSPSARARIS